MLLKCMDGDAVKREVRVRYCDFWSLTHRTKQQKYTANFVCMNVELIWFKPALCYQYKNYFAINKYSIQISSLAKINIQ